MGKTVRRSAHAVQGSAAIRFRSWKRCGSARTRAMRRNSRADNVGCSDFLAVATAPLIYALLQCTVEEVHRHLLQLARGCARDSVSLLWVQHKLELFAGELQGVGHLQRVLEQHVVIFEIVEDEKLALQVCRLR